MQKNLTSNESPNRTYEQEEAIKIERWTKNALIELIKSMSNEIPKHLKLVIKHIEEEQVAAFRDELLEAEKIQRLEELEELAGLSNAAILAIEKIQKYELEELASTAMQAVENCSNFEAAKDKLIYWLIGGDQSETNPFNWKQLLESTAEIRELYRRKLAGETVDIKDWKGAGDIIFNNELGGFNRWENKIASAALDQRRCLYLDWMIEIAITTKANRTAVSEIAPTFRAVWIKIIEVLREQGCGNNVQKVADVGKKIICEKV